MPGDYQILAAIHDEIGLGEFAEQMTAHLIDYAQRNDWFGRQIIDLGCGSGQSLLWLAQHGYVVTGVDQSPQMLNLARQTLVKGNAHANLIERDIRDLDGIEGMDLALALDVLHEMNSLRDLETTFQTVHNLLQPNKLLIFDLHTIEGLVLRQQAHDGLTYDSDTLTIIAENNYDYDRQIQRRHYTIFRKQDALWQRYGARRILRAYPIQGVTALVKRCGFDVVHVLDANLQGYKPGNSTTRVIIMAQKI